MTLLTHAFETHNSSTRPPRAVSDRPECRDQRRPDDDAPADESCEVTFERLAQYIEAMQADMVHQHRVELARQRIEEGHYDDPRVVDVTVDRLMAALGAVHANA